MIAKFRRRFIGLAMATQLFLLAAILLAMNLLNYQAILTEAGTLLATLAQNQGTFPELAAPTRETLPADKGPASLPTRRSCPTSPATSLSSMTMQARRLPPTCPISPRWTNPELSPSPMQWSLRLPRNPSSQRRVLLRGLKAPRLWGPMAFPAPIAIFSRQILKASASPS